MEMSRFPENDVERVEKYKGGNKLVRCMRMNLLTILTIAGVLLGGALGLTLRATASTEWTPREIMYINFAGDIFLRMLKSLILPLIISSLISAIANMDLSLSGKIALRAILYYLITTVFAVILGIILVVSIQPGKNQAVNSTETYSRTVTTADTLLDLVR